MKQIDPFLPIAAIFALFVLGVIVAAALSPDNNTPTNSFDRDHITKTAEQAQRAIDLVRDRNKQLKDRDKQIEELVVTAELLDRKFFEAHDSLQILKNKTKQLQDQLTTADESIGRVLHEVDVHTNSIGELQKSTEQTFTDIQNNHSLLADQVTSLRNQFDEAVPVWTKLQTKQNTDAARADLSTIQNQLDRNSRLLQRVITGHNSLVKTNDRNAAAITNHARHIRRLLRRHCPPKEQNDDDSDSDPSATVTSASPSDIPAAR